MRRSAPAAARGRAGAPGRTRCRPRALLRRDIEQEAVVRFFLGEGAGEAGLPVTGVGGIGKSTVTLAALHDGRVAARFGERRHFVRLDGSVTRATAAAAVAERWGWPWAIRWRRGCWRSCRTAGRGRWCWTTPRRRWARTPRRGIATAPGRPARRGRRRHGAPQRPARRRLAAPRRGAARGAVYARQIFLGRDQQPARDDPALDGLLAGWTAGRWR